MVDLPENGLMRASVIGCGSQVELGTAVNCGFR